MTEKLVGVVNAGSSSLKFAIYEGDTALLSGQVDGIGARPAASAKDQNGKPLDPPQFQGPAPATPADALHAVMPWLRERLGGRHLSALGHRVVHGGMNYSQPVRVTPEILYELESLVPLAPLHEPHNLSPIRAALTLAPEMPQVACFDTAFHRTIPEVGQAFALPYAFMEEGIRRYGFHGLSYEYINSTLSTAAPEIDGKRVIVAHLGSGCSLCAIKSGHSVATSMGFTALDGVPMSTRCGELDPGVVLYLLQQKGMTHPELEKLLYRQSGVLGLSGGISPDFRDLLASKDPKARFALDVFCYRVARHIGSLAAALGGLDGIVFTAGVGENAAPVRASICRACEWLGVELDEAANEAQGPRITTGASRVVVYVIPTNESLMIARHTRAVLAV